MIAIDNSILTSVQGCSTQAAIRYILGLAASEDAGPQLAGSAAHAAWAAWFRTNGDVVAAMAAFEAAYKLWATEHIDDPDDRLSWDNVSTIMHQWFAVHTTASLPVYVQPSLVEVGFAVPLDGDFVFVGRMDALGQTESGAWELVEHKTTGNLDDKWRRTHRSAAQITGYTFAAQHHLQAPVVGALINGVEFGKLPSSTRKCRFHGMTYAECRPKHAKFEAFVTERPPHLHAAWLETAISLARRFVALRDRVTTLDDLHAHAIPTEGQFTGACTRCPFNDYCKMGRPTAPAQAEAHLRADPWSPYAHAFQREEEKP